MAVTAQIPRNVSTATAGATSFPYNFKILSKSDLQVEVNGEARTVDVHYAVDGVGSDTGGNITFFSPLDGGDRVMRRRNMAIKRDVDYQNLGDLRSHTLNGDQDAPVMMLQQLAEQLDRTLTLPPGTAAFGQIPDPEPLRPLVWNADGTGLENGTTDLTGDMLLRPSLASPAGSELVGYRQQSPVAEPRTALDKLRERVSARDFGAAADGSTNDSPAVQNAAQAASVVHVAGGTHALSSVPAMGSSTLLVEGFSTLAGAGAVDLERINAILIDAGYFGGVPMVSDGRGRKYEILMGVIRQTPGDKSRWYFINDAGHRPAGFDTEFNPATGNLLAVGTDLSIFFRKTYGKVVSLIAAPDETLARDFGVVVGASVALDMATLRVSISRTVSGTISFDGLNWAITPPSIGFSATSVNFAGTTLTVAHDWCPANGAALTPYSIGGALDPYDLVLRDSDATSFRVSFRTPASGGGWTYLSGTPDTRASFAFSKTANTPVRLDGVGVSGDIDFAGGGNIWLFAIMEIAPDA